MRSYDPEMRPRRLYLLQTRIDFGRRRVAFDFQMGEFPYLGRPHEEMALPGGKFRRTHQRPCKMHLVFGAEMRCYHFLRLRVPAQKEEIGRASCRERV